MVGFPRDVADAADEAGGAADDFVGDGGESDLELIRVGEAAGEEVAGGVFLEEREREDLKFAEEIEKSEIKIGGIQDMIRIPDAMFILDIRKDNTAVDEAIRRGVPMIAVCDSNVDPTEVEYPIPANDDGVKSIELIAKHIANAISEGRNEWESARARLGGALVSQK